MIGADAPLDQQDEIWWTGRFPEAWPDGLDGWNTPRLDLARMLDTHARVVILDVPSFPWLMLSSRLDTPLVLRLPEEMRRVADHPGVVTHGLLRFGDFRDLLASCHLSIDVFDRNPERELAMVTRSVVALSCGLPVLHVPFTEVSPWIREYDAGWLVEEHDVLAMREILAKAAADLGTLARPRAGAVAVSERVLDPAIAAAPLADLLQSVVGC